MEYTSAYTLVTIDQINISEHATRYTFNIYALLILLQENTVTEESSNIYTLQLRLTTFNRQTDMNDKIFRAPD